MYPHERSLVARMKGKPFTILGVNSDPAERYKKAVKDALDGTWKTSQEWWGVKEGAIDLVAISDKVPADVKAKADEEKSKA